MRSAFQTRMTCGSVVRRVDGGTIRPARASIHKLYCRILRSILPETLEAGRRLREHNICHVVALFVISWIGASGVSVIMRVKISSVDYAPDELYAQTPFEAVLIREIPGTDRPDYWLAVLATPLRWLRNGVETSVTHLVLAARWQGTRIGRGMSRMPVGIAYVVDESLLNDARLDFGKCEYVAIGVADDLSADA